MYLKPCIQYPCKLLSTQHFGIRKLSKSKKEKKKKYTPKTWKTTTIMKYLIPSYFPYHGSLSLSSARRYPTTTVMKCLFSVYYFLLPWLCFIPMHNHLMLYVFAYHNQCHYMLLHYSGYNQGTRNELQDAGPITIYKITKIPIYKFTLKE